MKTMWWCLENLNFGKVKGILLKVDLILLYIYSLVKYNKVWDLIKFSTGNLPSSNLIVKFEAFFLMLRTYLQKDRCKFSIGVLSIKLNKSTSLSLVLALFLAPPFCFVHTIAQFSRILRFSHISYCQIFRIRTHGWRKWRRTTALTSTIRSEKLQKLKEVTYHCINFNDRVRKVPKIIISAISHAIFS